MHKRTLSLRRRNVLESTNSEMYLFTLCMSVNLHEDSRDENTSSDVLTSFGILGGGGNEAPLDEIGL